MTILVILKSLLKQIKNWNKDNGEDQNYTTKLDVENIQVYLYSF